MTVFRKTFFTLLISIVLCMGIAVLLLSTGVFSLHESRFYNSSAVVGVETDAETLNTFLSCLRGCFISALGDSAFDLIFGENLDNTESDIPASDDLSILLNQLKESVSGLFSLSILNSAGKQIYFSTYQDDLFPLFSSATKHRGYNDTAFLFSDDSAVQQEQFKLFSGGEYGYMVFSFPVYDSAEVFRGAAIFTVSAKMLTDALVEAGRTAVREPLIVSVIPQAVIAGLPSCISGNVSLTDKNGGTVSATSSGVTFSLITAPMDYGLFYGRVIGGDVFSLPVQIKAVVLTAVFLALFFIIFSLFNTGRSAAPVCSEIVQAGTSKNNDSLLPELPIAELSADNENLPEILPPEELLTELPMEQAELSRENSFQQLDQPVIQVEADADRVFTVQEPLEHTPEPSTETEIPAPILLIKKSGRGLLAAALPLVEENTDSPYLKPPYLRHDHLPNESMSNADFSGMDIEESIWLAGASSPIKNGEPENQNNVIVEQGGIPYINKQRANIKTSGEKLDGDFKKLVDSLTPPVP